MIGKQLKSIWFGFKIEYNWKEYNRKEKNKIQFPCNELNSVEIKIRRGEKGKLSKDGNLTTTNTKFEETPIWEIPNFRKSTGRIE